MNQATDGRSAHGAELPEGPVGLIQQYRETDGPVIGGISGSHRAKAQHRGEGCRDDIFEAEAGEMLRALQPAVDHIHYEIEGVEPEEPTTAVIEEGVEVEVRIQDLGKQQRRQDVENDGVAEDKQIGRERPYGQQLELELPPPPEGDGLTSAAP